MEVIFLTKLNSVSFASFVFHPRATAERRPPPYKSLIPPEILAPPLVAIQVSFLSVKPYIQAVLRAQYKQRRQKIWEN